MSVRVNSAFTFATISLLVIFVTVVFATSTDPFFAMSTCHGDCQTNLTPANNGCRKPCQCTPLLGQEAGSNKGDCTNPPVTHGNRSK
uniref:8 kDa Amblyomma family member n=1 Tax=Rhipicephalus zambeziensis TaxID=60191 RepID=A0A224YIB9_9ACAR